MNIKAVLAGGLMALCLAAQAEKTNYVTCPVQLKKSEFISFTNYPSQLLDFGSCTNGLYFPRNVTFSGDSDWAWLTLTEITPSGNSGYAPTNVVLELKGYEPVVTVTPEGEYRIRFRKPEPFVPSTQYTKGRGNK